MAVHVGCGPWVCGGGMIVGPGARVGDGTAVAGGALDVGGAANWVGGAVAATTTSVGLADRCALAAVEDGGGAGVGGPVGEPSCEGVAGATVASGVVEPLAADRDADAVALEPAAVCVN